MPVKNKTETRLSKCEAMVSRLNKKISDLEKIVELLQEARYRQLEKELTERIKKEFT